MAAGGERLEGVVLSLSPTGKADIAT